MLGIRTIIIFSLIFGIKINFQINIVVLRLENSWKSRILFNFIKVNQNLVWELNHVNLKSSSVHSARTKFNKNTLSIMSLSYREKSLGDFSLHSPILVINLIWKKFTLLTLLIKWHVILQYFINHESWEMTSCISRLRQFCPIANQILTPRLSDGTQESHLLSALF